MGRYANKAAAQKETRNPTELTDKHRVFVQEYAKCLNATKAAILAGYSDKSAQNAGSRLLSNPLIQAELDKFLADRCKNVEITVENVLKELASIGFAKQAVKDSDKIKALELIGRNLGMWDGLTGAKDKQDRESSLERFLAAIERHSEGKRET